MSIGVVDPFDFDDIEALRSELVGIIGDRLDHARMPVSARVSEPFEFIRPHVIEVDLYLEASTLQEFRNPELVIALPKGGSQGICQVSIFNHETASRLSRRDDSSLVSGCVNERTGGYVNGCASFHCGLEPRALRAPLGERATCMYKD